MTTEVATESLVAHVALGPSGAVGSIHLSGHGRAGVSPAAETGAGESEDTGPNPIAPEGKELVWGAGSFLVMLVLMRLFLFPRVKRGMDERYQRVRGDLEGADAVKAAARSDVAAYDKALAEVRAQAAARVDAARQTLDAERQSALAAANGRIAALRSDADAKLASARAAVRGQIAEAVAAVAARAAELAVGRAPSADVVRQSVAVAMESAGGR